MGMFSSVLACGSSHSLAIDSDGTVWAAGDNRLSQLGLPKKPSIRSFTPVPSLPPISQVFAEDCYSLFLDVDGGLWGCGSNRSGQLGLTSNYPEILESPIRIPNIPPILMASCSTNFCVLLDEAGAVWESGRWNNHLEKRASSFCKMDTANVGTIIKITTNYVCLTVMSKEHKLWKTGSGPNAGQFEELEVWKDENNCVRDFCCGYAHTLVLDMNGDVWSAGNNSSRQLGHGDSSDRSNFAKINNIPAMETIKCFGFSSLLIDKDGVAWSFGHNSVTGSDPQPIPALPKIIFGDGGYSHIILCDEQGTLWAFGSNNDGQLGLLLPTIHSFTQIQKVTVNPIRMNRFKQTKRAVQETN